jgi:hypothetical protein
MFRRRRQAKKLVQIARMLRELDAAAERPARSRRRARVMLNRT